MGKCQYTIIFFTKLIVWRGSILAFFQYNGLVEIWIFNSDVMENPNIVIMRFFYLFVAMFIWNMSWLYISSDVEKPKHSHKKFFTGLLQGPY